MAKKASFSLRKFQHFLFLNFINSPHLHIPMKSEIKLKGIFSLSERDILEFHPWVNPLLEEMRNRGWKYEFSNVKAEVLVELDLDELKLNLRYHPPRLEEFEEEGTYEISAELGSKPPAVLKILSIESFKIRISTKNCWNVAEIDPFKREINSIKDVLWGFGKEVDKLSRAREVYEVARWLIEKGFKPANDYVTRDYKKLVDMFEKPYRFTITLEIAVEDENKVPGWEELKKELSRFFYERGLLVELKKDDPFRKPIP